MLSSLATVATQAFGAPLYAVLSVSAMLLAMGYVLLSRGWFQKLSAPKGVSLAHGFLAAMLTVTALLAVENYRATDYYRFNSYLNAYEFFHYYLGSKYVEELGYTRLYAAALIADDETGKKWKDKSGTIRDLSTGGYVSAAQVLKDRETVEKYFTPERWEEFKKDVVWFKERLIQSRWNGVLRDKGYNGTPVWGMVVGTFFSNRISTDSNAGMMFLSLLDPLLILGAFAAVVWAFGPRTALFMIVLLGTQYMMKWWHMKGAFLRTDWIMLAIIAASLMKKRCYGLSGMVFAWPVLSRIFPGVFLFGPGARWIVQVAGLGYVLVQPRVCDYLDSFESSKSRRLAVAAGIGLALLLGFCAFSAVFFALVPWLAAGSRTIGQIIHPAGSGIVGTVFVVIGWAVLGLLAMALGCLACWGLWTRRLDRRWPAFFLAFGVTAVSLLALSGVRWKDTNTWPEYVSKIGAHNRGISEWRVGFKYIFMAEWNGPVNSASKLPHKELVPFLNTARYENGKTMWWTIQVAVLALCLLACAGLKDHRAFLLGFVPTFFLASPTYYYYIMLLLPLLFFAEKVESPSHALGLMFMFITGMSGYGFYAMWKQGYATYYWLSVEVMVMVLCMIALAYGEGLGSLIRNRRQSVQESSADYFDD